MLLYGALFLTLVLPWSSAQEKKWVWEGGQSSQSNDVATSAPASKPPVQGSPRLFFLKHLLGLKGDGGYYPGGYPPYPPYHPGPYYPPPYHPLPAPYHPPPYHPPPPPYHPPPPPYHPPPPPYHPPPVPYHPPPHPYYPPPLPPHPGRPLIKPFFPEAGGPDGGPGPIGPGGPGPIGPGGPGPIGPDFGPGGPDIGPVPGGGPYPPPFFGRSKGSDPKSSNKAAT